MAGFDSLSRYLTNKMAKERYAADMEAAKKQYDKTTTKYDDRGFRLNNSKEDVKTAKTQYAADKAAAKATRDSYKNGDVKFTDAEIEEYQKRQQQQAEGQQEDKEKTFGKRVAGRMSEGYRGAPNAFANYLGTKAVSRSLSQGDNNVDSRHLRQQAELHARQAGDEQKNSQREMQQGNQNPFVTAGQIATAQAASENTQKVKNSMDSAAASLERGVETPDIQGQQQYTAERRKEGVANQREAYGALQTAEEERNMADAANQHVADMTAQNMNVNYATSGGDRDGDENKVKQERPAETAEADATTEPEATPEQPEAEGAQQIPEGNTQNVINANLGSTRRRTYNDRKQAKYWRVENGNITAESGTANVQGASEWTADDERNLQALIKDGGPYNIQPGESPEEYKLRAEKMLRHGKNLGDEGFDDEASSTVPDTQSNIAAAVRDR